MRINGFASGMDIDFIVKQMMMAERMPLDKLEQRKQTLEWQQEAYREVNAKFVDFRNQAFNMRLPSSYLNRETTVEAGASFTANAGASAAAGTYTLQVEQLATSAQLVSQKLDNVSLDTKMSELIDGENFDSMKITLTGAEGEDGIELTINASDTMHQLVQKINQETSATGITANYDENLGRLFLSSAQTGETSFVGIAGDDADHEALLDQLFGYEADQGPNGVFTKKGNNAKITYNGFEGSYESNTFTINGTTFTAMRADSAVYNFTVTADTNKTFDQITEFIESYNQLIEDVNELMAEQKHRSYTPLTELQKEDMSDREIELWEEKARSGLLRRDSILSSAMMDFRNAIFSAVEGLPDGTVQQLFEIGITTGAYHEKGKLHIDEDKLRQALEERPDEVMALFTADDDDDKSQAGDGIARRFVEQADNVMAQLRDRALHATNSKIGLEIRDLEARMLTFENRLAQKETRYYNQFTQMEQFMSQMNEQSNQLMQMFFPQS